MIITATDLNKILEDLQNLQNEARSISGSKPRSTMDKQSLSYRVKSIQHRMDMALQKLVGAESIQV
jgi:hypothetical protein